MPFNILFDGNSCPSGGIRETSLTLRSDSNCSICVSDVNWCALGVGNDVIPLLSVVAAAVAAGTEKMCKEKKKKWVE